MILLIAYAIVGVLASGCVGRVVTAKPGRWSWFTPLFCLVAGLMWPLVILMFVMAREET